MRAPGPADPGIEKVAKNKAAAFKKYWAGAAGKAMAEKRKAQNPARPVLSKPQRRVEVS